MTLDKLKQFRSSVYTILGNAKDALFDLMDAVLVTRSVYSFVELSVSPVFRRQWSSIYEALGNRSRGGLQKNQTLSSGRQLGHSRRSRVIFNTRPELNVREKSRGYVMRMNFKTLLSKSFRTYAHINSLPKMSIRQLANQYSSFNYSQLSRKN